MSRELLRLTALLVPLGLMVLRPSPARACSAPAVGPPHIIDPAERGVDVQPPDPPQIGAIEISSYQSDDSGCSPQCGGDVVRRVRIPLTASDDRTPPDKIGYRLMPGAGAPFFGGVGDVEAKDGAITLTISNEEPFSFDLTIKSIDLAGNISAGSSTTHVSDPDSAGGCVVSRGTARGGRASAIVAAIALASALVARRKPRRSE